MNSRYYKNIKPYVEQTLTDVKNAKNVERSNG